MNDAIYRLKRRNRLQTTALSAVLLLIMIVAGWNVLGATGLIVALGGFALSVILSARAGVPVAAGRRLSYYDAPQLHRILGALSRRAGLPRQPEVFYVPSPTPNAAAVGDPEHPVLFVTDGILRRLGGRELEGVLAHEISHIRNNDLALFRFAETVRQMTTAMARFGWFLLFFSLPTLMTGGGLSLGVLLLLIVAPALSLLVQLAIMRSREFGADLGAVELTGDAVGLASALRKLEYPRFTLLGMGRPRGDDGSLFRTHPATEERINRLLDVNDRSRGNLGRPAARLGDSWYYV